MTYDIRNFYIVAALPENFRRIENFGQKYISEMFTLTLVLTVYSFLATLPSISKLIFISEIVLGTIGSKFPKF